MAWLPKSRTARRRLYVVGTSGVVLVIAGILAFQGLGDAASFFYTPTQAAEKHPPVGRTIQLGGFVQPGSVRRTAEGAIDFVVTDCGHAKAQVTFRGDLPDLFREGQGVVTKGSFQADGGFTASQVLAKHDERYMPRELTKTLKQSGEWRGGQQEGAAPLMAYQAACDAENAGRGAAKS